MSRSRRASRIPAWIDRLHLTVRVIALILGMVAAGGLSCVTFCNIVQPILKIERGEAENARLREQNARQARENKETRELITWNNTSRGAVEAGRKMGMVKPGEESVRILVPPAAPAAPIQTEAPPAPTGELILALVLFGLAFFVGLIIFLRSRRVARDTEGVLTPRSELNRRRRRYAH